MEHASYMERPDDELTFAPKAPGSFQRGKNNLQQWIAPDSRFKPAPGRYHVFINYGCGWCHQCMITLAAKGLQKVVSISHTGLKTVGKRGTDSYRGWPLPEDPTGNGFTSAFDVYNAAADYGQKQLTTPFLFDKETKLVVSNDPAQIILMLNGMFNEWAEKDIDLYPQALRDRIEQANSVIFPGVNDGVYRCWFAGTEEAYEDAYTGLQKALRWLDEKLSGSDYICGDRITLADIRAFPHVFRFDVIYHKLMLRDPRGSYLKETHPAIMAWLERMFKDPSVSSMSDLQVATRFYLSEPDDECDALYSSLKCSWMPSIEELAAKRSCEKLPALAAAKPPPIAAM